MDKYALGRRQLNYKKVKKDGLRTLDTMLISIIILFLVVGFFIGLLVGIDIGIDIGKEKTISEVLDIFEKGQERQGQGFIAFAVAKVGRDGRREENKNLRRWEMYICPWPGCGNIFPSGQKVPDSCPNCGNSPFAEKDEENQPFTYTADELKGRKIFMGVQ